MDTNATLFFKVLKIYHQKFNKDKKKNDYYLYWLENDILLELNNNKSLFDSIEPNMQRVFPKMTAEEIYDKIECARYDNNIITNLKQYWYHLSFYSKSHLCEKYK